jgi:citrate synthase
MHPHQPWTLKPTFALTNQNSLLWQVGVVGALSAFYPDSSDISNASQRRLSAIRLVAKLPTIAAITHKTSVGQPVVYPQARTSLDLI